MTIDEKISDGINREPVKMPALSSSKTDDSRLTKQAQIPFATTSVKQIKTIGSRMEIIDQIKLNDFIFLSCHVRISEWIHTL